MTYRCEFFNIRELVHPDINTARGVRAWELLRPDMLEALDALRRSVGRIVINNWSFGGSLKYAGLRPQTSDVGAIYSMHKYGGAFDLHPYDVTVEELYDHILNNADQYPAIRRMENIEATPTWVHIDCANHDEPGLKVFHP
jgi:hypothetical protein